MELEGKLTLVERLAQLRADGTLTEEEFATAKSSVLSVSLNHPGDTKTPDRIVPVTSGFPDQGVAEDDSRPLEFKPSNSSTGRQRVNHWKAYSAAAVTCLVAVFAIMLGARQDTAVVNAPSGAQRPPTPTERPEITSTIALARPVNLADAFQAATGHPSAFSVTEGGKIVTTTPLQILRLPFALALITKREIKDGCHACPGAVGVYYLKADAGKVLVTGRWRDAIEGWGWGTAPEWRLSRQFTSYPAIIASGGGGGGGIAVEGFTITELSPVGPVSSDVIRTKFSDEGAIGNDGQLACIVTGTVKNVRRNQSFAVAVRGSVTAMDLYVKKGQRFVPSSKIDWDMPCENL